MTITTRYYGEYIELKVEDGSLTFDTGFLDKKEAILYLENFRTVTEELECFIEED